MRLFNATRRINLRRRSINAFQRIIVDLTPVRPGGENGGAKLLATELVSQFSRQVAPEYEYVLLTSSDTHDELSWLDAENVRRVCVNERQPASDVSTVSQQVDRTNQVDEIKAEPTVDSGGNQEQPTALPTPGRERSLRAAIHSIGQTLERILPRSIYSPIYRFYRTYIKAPQTRDLLRGLEADLIFCPFTAPLYQRPGVPMVIIVYDLQYQAYPQFFSDEDLYHLYYYFRQSCQSATRLICISEYTRQSVLASSDVSPERVVTIPTSLFNRLETVSTEVIQQVLSRYDLREGDYLLYPANFWQHKNHEMLLTAFSMYLAQQAKSDLKLVLTGAPGERMDYLRQAALEMGLGEKIVFPGFVPAQEYSALLQACLALIFPSLYEGFGAPVVEAMALDKPVLCSNLTSLPEVTQSAAHLFDPRRPEKIVAAIEKIQQDAGYRMELVERGWQRMSSLMSPTEWASAYFEVFRQVMGEIKIISNAIYGVHPDHWTGDALEIAIVAGDVPRHLELTLEVPAWLPEPYLSVRVKGNQGKPRHFRMRRGRTETLQVPLQTEPSKLLVSFSPSVSPLKLGINKDPRLLSCQVLTCQLVLPDRSEFLYNAEN
ncbi:MAG TPA: glycosyltransferase family 1 protein [Anaerolineales bacterium]|nr:glycosyltransferase family 1 protein [Anaerolineales bacterium]